LILGILAHFSSL